MRDKPRVNQLERAGYTIHRVDISINPWCQRRYRFAAVPFYLVVRHGEIVLRTHDLNLVIQVVRNARSI